MSLNETPTGERVQIGIFGKRNAGKSSILNMLTGQTMSVVSEVKGTTTDPVKKSMELLPIGPVTFIDTPGMDDFGELGSKRVEQTWKVLRMVDIALLVIEAGSFGFKAENDLLDELRQKNIPYIIVVNKTDLLGDDINKEEMKADLAEELHDRPEHILLTSTVTNPSVNANFLRIEIGKLAVTDEKERYLVRDLIRPGDNVVLVIPVDYAAPKGRIILPQQQVIRDVLDAKGFCSVAQTRELPQMLANMKTPPALVITDSQAFAVVADIVPKKVPLTSFSILMSRYKGDLVLQTQGAKALSELKGGERILISEGCTHHRQCGDIGTQKLPALIRKKTGKDFSFEFTSGGDFPEDLSKYSLVIHCGACTLPIREIRYRMQLAKSQNVPITNYGVLIAYLNGILGRVLTPFSSDEVERG